MPFVNPLQNDTKKDRGERERKGETLSLHAGDGARVGGRESGGKGTRAREGERKKAREDARESDHLAHTFVYSHSGGIQTQIHTYDFCLSPAHSLPLSFSLSHTLTYTHMYTRTHTHRFPKTPRTRLKKHTITPICTHNDIRTRTRTRTHAHTRKYTHIHAHTVSPGHHAHA